MKKYLVCFALLSMVSPSRAAETKSVGPSPLGEIVPLRSRRAESKKIYEYIPLRNVTPRMVAWWLDPEHNPVPLQFLSGLQSARQMGMDNAKMPQQTLFSLPAGVERIVAVEPQNALLAVGTEAGIEELKRIAASLDRPLQLVEISAEIVQLAPADLKLLGLDTLDANSLAIKFVSGPEQEILAQMKAQGRAKVLHAPRATAINGLSCAIMNVIATPLLVPPSEIDAFPATIIYDGIRLGFAATPTIENENSISLIFQPLIERGVMQAKSLLALEPDETTWHSFRASPFVALRFNDGDSVAVVGARPISQTATPRDIKKVLPRTKAAKTSAPPRTIVYIITARIIRRIENPVAGT